MIFNMILPKSRKPSILPDGYLRLQWIGSDNAHQYMDTGFRPTQNTRVQMAFEGTGPESSSLFRNPFGTRTSGSSPDQFCVALMNNNGKWRSDFYKSRVVGTGTRWVGRHEIDKNRASCKIDGEVISNLGGTFRSPESLTIFGQTTAGAMSEFAPMRLFSCKISDNDVPQREFIPCKNPSGAVGVYDIVGKAFYGSKAGSFIAGPVYVEV